MSHNSHDDYGQDFDASLSDVEMEELSLEMPALARLRDFARLLGDLPWFTALGTPLDRESKEIAAAYLDGLGFPDAHVARIKHSSLR
ncbi:MAG: hypothetical protein P1U84_16680 [Parvibaculaceae bacterium]|nr:hypothetical protein [Parvibaculaceae bacterium]